MCFRRSGRRILLPSEATLVEATRRAGLPVAGGCEGHALCGRCGLRILAGGEALTPEQPEEVRAKRANRIEPSLRLACRTRLRSDVVVTAYGG